jgi:hypothetical protein
MEYNGKLYGKDVNEYFDTGRTTDDYDRQCELSGGELPDDICGHGGVYTKKGSDLFIQNDVTPHELRLIAKHMEDALKASSLTSAIGCDRELMDYLASRWNSQGKGHHLMGAYFENTSGSFREAIRAKMTKDQNVE